MPASTDFQLWQPPEGWSPERPVRRGATSWLIAGVVVLLAMAVVAAVALAVVAPSRHVRPLPRSAAEALAWEGKHVTVETGVAPDGRGYTFEVSRNKFGDLCEFLMLTAPQGGIGGGGGGGCGGGGSIGFGYSSNGAVDGLTSAKVATVDIELPTGRVSVVTKPLPPAFGNRRYYVGIFAPGTKPLGVVGRASDGSVVGRAGSAH